MTSIVGLTAASLTLKAEYETSRENDVSCTLLIIVQCYAKCIDLSAEKEPDIFHAIKFGSILENVVFDPTTRLVNYTDSTLTENTRWWVFTKFLAHDILFANANPVPTPLSTSRMQKYLVYRRTIRQISSCSHVTLGVCCRRSPNSQESRPCSTLSPAIRRRWLGLKMG